MGRHRVVDIRRLSSARPSEREAARTAQETSSERELYWLGGIVEVVTATGVAGSWQRAIVRCDEPTCDNPVAVRRTGDACEWYCPSCATFGAVIGWRGGKFDLSSALDEDDSDRSDATIFARLDELESVRRCDLTAPLKLTLARSSLQADYVVTPCAERQLSELLCALEDAIRRAPSQERHLIDRFVARVDSALLACESRDPGPPTLH